MVERYDIVITGKSQIMRQAKRVLMCWEFGSGNGHVRQLKIIGERLEALGFDVVYALRRPDAGSAIGIPADAIRAAPNWPLRSPPAHARKAMTSATYGDFLAQLMLGPRDDLAERFQKWHALVDAERPDLIIADYAPSISLLYHSRIPVLAIGNGYVLPPTSLTAFPRLIDDVPMQFEESDAVAQINKALRPYNKLPISYFPQINRADRAYLLTFPCLDPYRESRDGGWLGSPSTKDIVLRMRPAQWMFAYFNEQQQTDARLIEGLVRSRLPGKAIFSVPLRRTVRQLEAADIAAPDGLAYLPFELLSCGVIVHAGNAGMAMAGIAAGIPQVMIRTDIEKTLIAKAIVARNAGTMLRWNTFDMPELAIAIRSAVDNAAMQKAARDLSLENTRYLQLDPVAEIVKGVTEYCQ
jgi:rhamnosyltransferase subunit B